MKKTRFDATTLKAVMIFVIIVLIGVFVGGFYFAENWLSSYATEINTTSAELARNDSTQTQNELKTELFRLKPVVDKASAFVADSNTYMNGLRQDVNKYASDTGIEISDISPTQLPVGASVSNVTGLQAKYAKITLKNPIIFNNFMKFIKAIETNVPKMRLTGINLSHSAGAGSTISVDPLIVEVYTR